MIPINHLSWLSTQSSIIPLKLKVIYSNQITAIKENSSGSSITKTRNEEKEEG